MLHKLVSEIPIWATNLFNDIKYFAVRLSSPDTRPPDLVMCPANITIGAGAEETNVSWSQPEFSESLGFQLNVTSTFGKNTVSLGWGERRVEYTARNTYNNMVTTCVFYVDVTRKSELTRYTTE